MASCKKKITKKIEEKKGEGRETTQRG